jgi:hypothetical protein
VKRRRWVLAAALAALVGGVCSLSRSRLSPQEQLMVGTWRTGMGGPAFTVMFEFTADRQVRFWTTGQPRPRLRGADAGVGRWAIRGGRLVLNAETNAAERAVGWLHALCGIQPGTAAVYPLGSYSLRAVTADKVVVDYADSKQIVWTRVPDE